MLSAYGMKSDEKLFFCQIYMVTFFKLGPNCVTSQILKDLHHFSLLFI